MKIKVNGTSLLNFPSFLGISFFAGAAALYPLLSLAFGLIVDAVISTYHQTFYHADSVKMLPLKVTDVLVLTY
jgi:hypothetical protein